MNRPNKITRRHVLKTTVGLTAAAAGHPFISPFCRASDAPALPVAIGKCAAYDKQVMETLQLLLDAIGGIGALVKGKSVCVKVNLTGDPRRGVAGIPANRTYHTHPDVLHATCALLGKAGAKRITIVESLLFNRPKEEVFEWAGWDLSSLKSAADNVHFEDTRNKGTGSQYATIHVPWGGYTYPAYEVNEIYAKSDVCVSIAKLKEHITAGVTLTMKNLFGVTPNSIYGSDAGSEDAHSAREPLHTRRKKPATDIQEIDPDCPRHGGYIVPRVTADLVGARPIDIAIIDGIECMQGGEGPWCRNVRPTKPGLLIVGKNPVCTDAVGMAIMGFDPTADRGTIPFKNCDNHLRLAAAVGLGSNDLSQIEIRGVPLKQALHPFDASLRTEYPEQLQKMFIR
ncbi:MAG: DUF362 domain-containing protein [Candidatus Omnitrophica bacterium]|nr:DUF362 domain-containing protein [Candidatus Omnitrophota bacterium]